MVAHDKSSSAAVLAALGADSTSQEGPVEDWVLVQGEDFQVDLGEVKHVVFVNGPDNTHSSVAPSFKPK